MSAPCQTADITRAFEAQDLDATRFHHAEHVRVAFDLLRKHDFIDAASAYAKGLRTIAAAAGAPMKFNLTITYAFMSLIAERMDQSGHCDFDSFVSRNPDVMHKDVLRRWYDDDRLHSDQARSVFLLPT